MSPLGKVTRLSVNTSEATGPEGSGHNLLVQGGYALML